MTSTIPKFLLSSFLFWRAISEHMTDEYVVLYSRSIKYLYSLCAELSPHSSFLKSVSHLLVF